MVDTIISPVTNKPSSYVEWGPVFAGAVGAAAISFLLLGFGSAIGLTAVSPWPNAGLPVALVAILGAIWLLTVQVGSFAAGGYLAGRLRAPAGDRVSPERHFRDGAHGFLVWGLGTLLGIIALAIASGGLLSLGAGVAADVAGIAAQGAASNPALGSPAEMATDLLLRPASAAPSGTTSPTPPSGSPTTDPAPELNRLFTRSLLTGTLAPNDSSYLATLVAARTGLSPEEAQQRVTEAFAAGQQAVAKIRETADAARRGAAVAGFAAAASLLISLVAATAAAGLGGRHRDEGQTGQMFWSDRLW
jgi:hypothetical protein